MANTSKFSVPSPYDQQMAEIQRRQKMAELMQQQGLEPLESMTAPGGMVVPTSPLLGLAKMLQVGLGSRALNAVEKQRGEAEEKGRTEATDWLDSLQRGKQSFVGQPLTQDQVMEAALAPGGAPTQPTGQMVSQPYTAQERATQIQKASFSGNPNMRLAAQLAATQKVPTAPIKDIDVDKFTPESIGAFQSDFARSGAPNYSLLKPVDQKPAAVPADIQAYNFAKEQGYTGTYLDFQKELRKAGATNVTTSYGAPVSGVDAQGNPVFFQPSKEGGKPAIIPGVAPVGKDLTAEQSNAAGFHSRMLEADKILSGSPFLPTVKSEMTGKLPFSNKFLTEENQKVNQAKLNFITAELRKESGASISPSEFDTGNKMYFPQVGDTPEVIKQKALTRQHAIEAMAIAAGKRNKPAQVPVSPTAIDQALAKYGIGQ